MSEAKPMEQDKSGEGSATDNVVELPRVSATERGQSALAFVKEHPGLALIGGIAAGVLISALLPRRPRSKLGKRGGALGDAVAATATMIARRAVEGAETTGDSVKRSSRRAAKRSEDLGEFAMSRIAPLLSSLLERATDLSQGAADQAEKLGKTAGKTIAKAGDAAEDAAVLTSRRIGKAAKDARSRIIG